MELTRQQATDVKVTEEVLYFLEQALNKFDWVRVDMFKDDMSLDFMQKGCRISDCDFGRNPFTGKWHMNHEPYGNDDSRWSFDLLPYCDYAINKYGGYIEFKDGTGFRIGLSF